MNKLSLIGMLSSTIFIMSCSPTNKKSSLPQPPTANTQTEMSNSIDVTSQSTEMKIIQLHKRERETHEMRIKLEREIFTLQNQIARTPVNAEELKKQLSIITHENERLKEERISIGKQLYNLEKNRIEN